MTRLLLHVLLALTLALNGISAPWAMARMSKTDHSAHGTHAGHGMDSMVSSKSSMNEMHGSHHAQHDGHGADHADTAPTAPKDAADLSCCNGTTCECGCVLPPVVPVVTVLTMSEPLVSVPFVLLALHAVVRRGSPPFRPPTR